VESWDPLFYATPLKSLRTRTIAPSKRIFTRPRPTETSGACGILLSRPQLENAGTADKGMRICGEAL
jgi:hypothetical protein